MLTPCYYYRIIITRIQKWMWGGDIDALSVFPLAVESSVIWAISRKVSSLLAVEATARGRFVLRLGRMLPGEGWPSRSGPGAIARPVALYPASGTFPGGGGRSPRGALVVVRVRGRPAWMKSSAASSLVSGMCFCTHRQTSSGMVLISCSFTKMSRMSVASVLSVLAFVQWLARSHNRKASSRGISPALSLAARKRCRYASALILYRRRIAALRLSYMHAESAAMAA